MYQGQHWTSFVGSERERERQGYTERARAVQEANRTPLPAPTPAGELFRRWEASRAPPLPESPRVSAAQSRAPSARSRASMVASSRGPHSARVESRLESARRELERLHELQHARETIKQLREELGLPVLRVNTALSDGDGGRGGKIALVPLPGNFTALRSPAKRRPLPPTDIFAGTGGDVIWYRGSEFKTESQRGPRVGGRRQPLTTAWRG